MTLNPRRSGPDIGDVVKPEVSGFNEIVHVIQLRGVGILYLIFVTCSIVILIIEINLSIYLKK